MVWKYNASDLPSGSKSRQSHVEFIRINLKLLLSLLHGTATKAKEEELSSLMSTNPKNLFSMHEYLHSNNLHPC